MAILPVAPIFALTRHRTGDLKRIGGNVDAALSSAQGGGAAAIGQVDLA
jgi:hypothetical protein